MSEAAAGDASVLSSPRGAAVSSSAWQMGAAPSLSGAHNEPKRERRDKTDVLRSVRELCCCVSSPALQWSFFFVVFLLFLQGCFSAAHFKYLLLWNFLFLKTLMAFILVEEKMGNPGNT